MRALPFALITLLAAPALAEDLNDTGYLTGCDPEGSPLSCYVTASGANFVITQGAGTPDALFDQLLAMEPVTPVQMIGSFEFVGDVTVEAVLTDLTVVKDDLYEGNLKAMQGKWAPVGEETPFYIEIAGLDWVEVVEGEVADSFMMMPGESCGNGITPGNGMAITLYRYGDDPEDDGCWLMEYVDDAKLTLRDFKGEQGQVDFARVLD